MIVLIGVHEYFSRGSVFGAILNPVCLLIFTDVSKFKFDLLV